MKILHVVPGLASRIGGSAIAVVATARAAEAAGAMTAIYATDLATTVRAPDVRGGIRPDELAPGADALNVRLFPVRRPYRIAYSPELGAALSRHARAFDVVHIHSLFSYPQFAAFRAAQSGARPYIVSPHGALDPYLRRRGRLRKFVVDALWQRRMLDRAALLHVTAPEESRLMADLNLRSTPYVVPLAVDIHPFATATRSPAFRDRFLGDSQGPLILCHGRITEKKGLDTLVAAVAQIRPAHPDIHLVLAGPDDDGLRPRLEAEAARLGLHNHVSFTGMLHGTDLYSALASADIWALPSHTENFGLAVVEALAAGLPSVLSPAINIAPEIQSAEAALVAPATPESFARGIMMLLSDDEQRGRIAANARSYARRYDWAATGARFVEMYTTAIKGHRSRHAMPIHLT